MMVNVKWYHLYGFGIKLGILCLRNWNINLGLRSLCNPIRTGFNRYIEIPYAINTLKPKSYDHILDIASPKHVALFIRASFSSHITAIDIMPDFKESYEIYEQSLGINGISWEVKDARNLDYADASFDKVYSISVLEHIPNNGDTLTIKEIERILKPGGICVITLPFSSSFKEMFKNTNVYERKYEVNPIFFQRVYDEEALTNRIIVPSVLKEIDRQYYRSCLNIEALWDKLPRRVQMSLHWIGPILSKVFYYRIDAVNAFKKKWTGFCCITLKKNS